MLPEHVAPSVVTIGNFDGVHRGHREIIHRVKTCAIEQEMSAVVYTFRPHPVKLLAPHLAPPLINTYEQKREILASLGVDTMIEEPFDRAYASYSPEQFVSEILHHRLNTRTIYIGFDFTFGRGGKAGGTELSSLANSYGIQVHVVPPLSFDGIVASSTKIREFVLEGQMDGARMLLGRYFYLQGPVVQGFQRGRLLGFPTANLQPDQELMPAYGVYASWVETSMGDVVPAISNVGIRPTFQETPSVSVETHLFDFSANLYGETLRVHLAKRLRPEHAFSSVDALRSQIASDIQSARECLSSSPHAAPPAGGLQRCLALARQWEQEVFPTQEQKQSMSPTNL